jgi:HEPN domain-containing protein
VIKAVLVSAGVHPPRSHDIGHLLDLLGGTHPLHEGLASLARLTPFAWLFRYPAADPTEPMRPVPTTGEVVVWLGELRRAVETVKKGVA